MRPNIFHIVFCFAIGLMACEEEGSKPVERIQNRSINVEMDSTDTISRELPREFIMQASPRSESITKAIAEIGPFWPDTTWVLKDTISFVDRLSPDEHVMAQTLSGDKLAIYAFEDTLAAQNAFNNMMECFGDDCLQLPFYIQDTAVPFKGEALWMRLIGDVLVLVEMDCKSQKVVSDYLDRLEEVMEPFESRAISYDCRRRQLQFSRDTVRVTR